MYYTARMQSFIVPLKPVSWNTIAAKNRWAYMSIKDEWLRASNWAIKQAKLRPVTQFPIEIHIEASWKGKRSHDLDNIYMKATIDALKKAGIIPDDSLAYVQKICITGQSNQPHDQLKVTLL